MTVESATNRVTFTGDDVTTSFGTTPVKFFATSDLLVYVTTTATGVTALKTEGTHYTVSGGDAASGAVGTVNLAGGSSPHGALLTGTKLVIIRELPLLQGADFVQNDSSNAEVAEAALDKLVMNVQRLDDLLARSLVVSDGDVSGADFTVPTPVASKLLGWSSSGLALQLYASADLGAIVPSAFMETLLDDGTAAVAFDTFVANGGAGALLAKLTTEQFALTGILSPAQITANQNDYAPTGHAAVAVFRLNSDARRNVTGLAGGAAGRVATVHNVGTFPIVFTYEDAASTAANRFAFGCTLGGGQSMEIVYDSTSSRWRAKHTPEPIGTIKDFGTSTMPAAFLAIDQNVSRTTYAALFNEIGTAWGAGDGSTTFGLYIGASAALIAAGTGTQTAAGVDADVDLTGNTLAVTSNTDKWITGMAVVFNLTSGTITGLVDNTTYYVIRSSATLIQLASTLANAQNGTAIDFTAKSSPVWDITHTYTARTHGQRIGAESHAMSSTELLSHEHSYNSDQVDGTAADRSRTGASGTTQVNTTEPTGGNAAMNIMNPSTVVTRGIRYI